MILLENHVDETVYKSCCLFCTWVLFQLCLELFITLCIFTVKELLVNHYVPWKPWLHSDGQSSSE